MKNIIPLVFLLFVFGCCDQSKITTIPVSTPFPKPKNIPIPHDYMGDLNKDSKPSEFVKSCLMTRASYKNAYESCVFFFN